MLLRASSEKLGEDADLRGAIGDGDGGVPHGEKLVAYAEAITRGSDDADEARSAVRTALGEEAFGEAAAIVGIFNGLVRTADATGIPLDDNTLHQSAGFRSELGLDDFAGARNSSLDRADPSQARAPGDPKDEVLRQFK